MVTNFAKGPNYIAVRFNEYVIINSKTDPNVNGRIYRRGYDYTNDMGGAIYIGTMAGPQGEAGSNADSISIEAVQMVYENPSNWQNSEFLSKTNALSDGGIWWILES